MEENRKILRVDESNEMLECITDGIWEWDIKDDRRHFYPTWSKKYGYNYHEINSTFDIWKSLIHPEDLEVVMNTVDRYLRRDIEELEIEYRIKTSNGQYKWISDRGRATWDEDNNPLFMMGNRTDITKQKILEKKLEDKDKEILQLFYNHKIIMFLIDPQIGKIIDVNDAACQFYGYDKKTMLAMSVFDIDTANPNKILDNMKTVIDDGFKTLDINNRLSTGEIRTLKAYCSKLEIGDKEYIHVILHDITEEKHILNMFLESEKRYKKLIDLSPDAIVLHSSSKYIYANDKAADLLGVKESSNLIGRSLFEFCHPGWSDIAKFEIEYILRTHEDLTGEYKIKREDGTLIDVEIASSTLPYNGESVIMSIIRDITQRKKEQKHLEQMVEEKKKLIDTAMEYDRLKTDFFSNISHELKTPLNIIFSTVQLMNPTLCNQTCERRDKLNKHINITKQNCYRLIRLINNLIDITRLDSNFLDMSFKNHNIVSVVEDIVLSVSEYRKHRGIDIIFDTDVEEKIIACDVDKMERIILNLLSNAVKFTKEKGQIFVNILDHKDKIMISVKDTGIGIPSEKLDIIFDRFRQVDSLLTRNREGSGIGLSLVKSLVETHGGKIKVLSQVGVGSEFIIELPCNELSNILEECKEQESIDEEKIERISIEFSDIYS